MSATPSVQLEHFEGPLDLLLYLIRRSEIDIYDIPIAQITEQYLSYLRLARADLEDLSEFYLMAATLLYIKSRMLLPVQSDLDDGFEDPRQELVEQLIEYQKLRRLSELMEQRQAVLGDVLERPRGQRSLPLPEDSEQWEELSVWALFQAFSGLISAISSERILNLRDASTVEEKLSLLRELLSRRNRVDFRDLLSAEPSPFELVCAFLAVLEAVRADGLAILQNRLFGDIRLERRNPTAA